MTPASGGRAQEFPEVSVTANNLQQVKAVHPSHHEEELKSRILHICLSSEPVCIPSISCTDLYMHVQDQKKLGQSIQLDPELFNKVYLKMNELRLEHALGNKKYAKLEVYFWCLANYMRQWATDRGITGDELSEKLDNNTFYMDPEGDLPRDWHAFNPAGSVI